MKNKRSRPANRVLAAIDSHQWLISDEWMETIRSIAVRSNDFQSFMNNKPEGASMHDVEALIPMHEGRLEGTTAALRKGSMAIIPIIGPIFPRANLFTEFSGAASIESIARDTQLAKAAGLEPILYFSTPGGVVEGISDYAKSVKAMGLRGFVSGNCASAGYWIGSQCTELFVADTAIIGNIGVKGPNPRKGADDSIVSDNAPNKKMTAGMVKGIVNDIETVFISAVASGRGVSVEHAKEHFGQGGVFVGQKAVDAGLADGVSTLEAILHPSANPARTKPEKQTMAITTEEQAKIDADLAQAKIDGANEATASATTAAQTRIKDIMAIAPDKPIASQSLAFNTAMTVEEATAALAPMKAETAEEPAAPAAPAAPQDPLATHMAGTNPKVAANGTSADDSDEEETQADIDASWDNAIAAGAA